MISIKNLRKWFWREVYDVKCDRSSPLGNPYVMKDEWERLDVCMRYEVYLWDKVREWNNKVCDELNRLYLIYKKYWMLNLYCWCFPKRCHCESIKNVLDSVC